MDQIDSFLKMADSDTLFIFDIDWVLLVSKDSLGRPAGKKVATPFFKAKTQEENDYLVSRFLTATTWELVENKAKEIIATLNQQKIPVIALTKMAGKNYGIIDNVPSWRVKTLQNLGIEFVWEKAQITLFWGDDSGAQNGVICAGKQKKSESLAYFLDQIDYRPKRIVMIDDIASNLQDVGEYSIKNNIEFYGIEYIHEEFKHEPAPNKCLIEWQLKQLFENQTWVNDTEAKKQTLGCI